MTQESLRYQLGNIKKKKKKTALGWRREKKINKPKEGRATSDRRGERGRFLKKPGTSKRLPPRVQKKSTQEGANVTFLHTREGPSRRQIGLQNLQKERTTRRLRRSSTPVPSSTRQRRANRRCFHPKKGGQLIVRGDLKREGARKRGKNTRSLRESVIGEDILC